MSKAIGVRREDKYEWERRAPLTPAHVAKLVQAGVEVYVQPSALRAFREEAYRAAGATVQEDLSPCSTIVGVKEIPLELRRHRYHRRYPDRHHGTPSAAVVAAAAIRGFPGRAPPDPDFARPAVRPIDHPSPRLPEYPLDVPAGEPRARCEEETPAVPRSPAPAPRSVRAPASISRSGGRIAGTAARRRRLPLHLPRRRRSLRFGLPHTATVDADPPAPPGRRPARSIDPRFRLPHLLTRRRTSRGDAPGRSASLSTFPGPGAPSLGAPVPRSSLGEDRGAGCPTCIPLFGDSALLFRSTAAGGRTARFSGRTVRVSGRGCAARVFRISACRSVRTAL